MTRSIKMPDKEFFGHIGRCWLSLKQAGKKMLSDLKIDLTIEQAMALKILEVEEGLSLSEISERSDRERTTMSRMIDGLERRNLVIRIPDKSDNRRKLLYLTHMGRQQIAALTGIIKDFSKSAYVGIPPRELETAIDVISRISANLEKM